MENIIGQPVKDVIDKNTNSNNPNTQMNKNAVEIVAKQNPQTEEEKKRQEAEEAKKQFEKDHKNELDVKKRFTKFLFCDKDQHQQNQLNMICFDQTCKQIHQLDPMCSMCLDQKIHNKEIHQTKNLHNLLIEVAQQVDNLQNKSQQINQLKQLFEISKKFRELAEKCNGIALNMMQTLKNNSKKDSQKNEIAQKTSEILKHICKSQTQEDLAENLKNLREITDLKQKTKEKKECELVLKTSQHSDLSTDLTQYQEKMQYLYNYLENSIDYIESECNTIKQQGNSCAEFEINQNDIGSIIPIKELSKGILFEGIDSTRFSRIFSKDSYDKERVITKFVFEKIDFDNFFSFGIVKEKSISQQKNNSNQIFHSFFDIYQCNMESYPPKRSFRNIAKEGVIFYGILDLKLDIFEIIECTGQVKIFYKRIPNYLLANDKWKFFIYFKGKHRIRIIQ